VDAHYAYVGGYKLQEKIGHHDFTHPLIERAQNPMSFRRTVEALQRMMARHGFDFIHAHLTYDHWLARFAARDRSVPLARTFHARRTLRSDPFTKSLVRRSRLLCVANDAFRHAALLRDRSAIFTPPPVDQRQFAPQGDNVRHQYGIASQAPLFVAIGKLSPGRGFEDVLRTFAVIRTRLSTAMLMIIGHGVHRAALEEVSRALAVADHVTWAGYHETDLADHYRSADALLFTAAGSDEGHRLVIEAMACGVPPVSYPIDGVDAVFGNLRGRLMAASASPEELATQALTVLSSKSLRDEVIERSSAFNYDSAARRLIDAYSSAM
jgi:glycosyltransferase involved in cell wall biosynthesis